MTQPEEDGMAIKLFLLLGKRFGERACLIPLELGKEAFPMQTCTRSCEEPHEVMEMPTFKLEARIPIGD